MGELAVAVAGAAAERRAPVHDLEKDGCKKKGKSMSACNKSERACADGAQVRHLAQKALFKHLLLTAPRGLLVHSTAIFR